MKFLKILVAIVFVASSVFMYQACNTLNQIKQTFVDLQKLQFKLENVNGFSVAGIGISNKKAISDFSLSDGLKLAAAFKTKKFPAEFTLNVAAKNPNDGKSSTNAKQTNASITSLDWRLYIDDVQTISGDISAPVTVPGNGQSTIIPLRMSLDLFEFFGNQGYDKVVNLALAIGGVNGSAAKIKLDCKPTVTTNIGNISYPNRITVVNKEWK